MESNNFHYTAVLLDMLYGIEIEEENLEELGLRAWELIGNKITKLYSYTTDTLNKLITLPCNVSSIESVSACNHYLNYLLIDNTLYFDKDYKGVKILYKGLILDEDGLPQLTNKEAAAIATFIAYVHQYKEGLKTNNIQLIQLSKDLEMKWNKLCDLARVTNLNYNDIEEILNIRDSWGRHKYGKKFGNRMGL